LTKITRKAQLCEQIIIFCFEKENDHWFFWWYELWKFAGCSSCVVFN